MGKVVLALVLGSVYQPATDSDMICGRSHTGDWKDSRTQEARPRSPWVNDKTSRMRPQNGEGVEQRIAGGGEADKGREGRVVGNRKW